MRERNVFAQRADETSKEASQLRKEAGSLRQESTDLARQVQGLLQSHFDQTDAAGRRPPGGALIDSSFYASPVKATHATSAASASSNALNKGSNAASSSSSNVIDENLVVFACDVPSLHVSQH